jgi:hypothetical protein
MHWWDDIVTAILSGIAAFLAILAASATGWVAKRGQQTESQKSK